MTDLTLTDAQRTGLAAVADAVSAVPARSELSSAVTDQLVARTSATISDVHTHALLTLQTVKDRIAELEKTIALRKERLIAEMTTFVELINDSLEAAKEIDVAVARVGDNVNGTGPK